MQNHMWWVHETKKVWLMSWIFSFRKADYLFQKTRI